MKPSASARSTCAFSTCRGEGLTGEPSCQTTSARISAVPSSQGMRRSEARSGHEPEVAVAALPARDLVPGLRVHFHVEAEQVVAALDLVAAVHLGDEELGVQALAHQAPLHVGERDDHRVDLAALDQILQFVVAEHASEHISVRRGDDTPPMRPEAGFAT